MRTRVRLFAVGFLLLIGTAILARGGTAQRATAAATGPLYLTSSRVERAAATGAASTSRVIDWAPGSWCWFGDPRAVHVGGPDGPTFVGWIDWRGRITIGVFDPRTGMTHSQVIGRQAVDDHGSPSILIEPDKRLTVFWSGHSGPAMNYRTSVRPLDIGRWGPIHHVVSALDGPKGFTYPNPVMLSGEQDRLYLFWRGADWSQDYATRTLAGRWSAAHRLIAVQGERPYVKVDSNGTDTIALAFTNGHPRGVVTSIFYAAYRAGALWHADGRRIEPLSSGPIAPQQADVVYNAASTGVRAWVWDVAYAAGHPVIAYATFPSPQRHLYWYARWSGQRWISHLMTVGGPTISPHTIEREYSGGLALDHANPSIVYLARKVDGWYEIERWTTHDGGYSWRYSTVVRTPGADDVRPLVPRGADSARPMGVLWLHGHYRSYTTYRTSVAYLG